MDPLLQRVRRLLKLRGEAFRPVPQGEDLLPACLVDAAGLLGHLTAERKEGIIHDAAHRRQGVASHTAARERIVMVVAEVSPEVFSRAHLDEVAEPGALRVRGGSSGALNVAAADRDLPPWLQAEE
eukprot:scaffold57_cov254-Pinguiococcus_pyrenoidosus.AAC.38